MSVKNEFINYVEEMIKIKEMTDEVKAFWEVYKGKESDKPLFTENGLKILKYMQDNSDITMFKAKDIGEGLDTTSRIVSGSIRKLVTDQYVEKIGQNPTIYVLSEKGKNFDIDKYFREIGQ